jgi:type II secretion system protein L
VPTTLFIPDREHLTADIEVDAVTTVAGNQAKRLGTLAMLVQTAALDKQNDIVIIIPLARIAFIDIRLPKVSAQKRDQLVNFAIEDKLTIDPSTVQAVVLGASLTSAQHHVVAAISGAWFADVLSWLKAHGVTPKIAIAASSTYRVADQEWLVVLNADCSMAIRADGLAYSIDANLDSNGFVEPPFQLSLALNEAVAAESGHAAPRTIRVIAAAPMKIDEAQWRQSLGGEIDIVFTPEDSLGAPVVASPATTPVGASNLLTGKYLPVRQGVSAINALKSALVLGFVILLLQFIFLSIDAWRLSQQRSTIENDMRQLFQTRFPQAQTIVDPALQMSRNLAALQNERGLKLDAARELLSVAATIISEAAPSAHTSIQQVNADATTITLSLGNLSTENEAALQKAQQDGARQYTVRLTKTGDKTHTLTIRLSDLGTAAGQTT